MRSVRWHDWSCEVVVASPAAVAVTQASAMVRDELRRFGRAVSRFDPTSEVCRIARSGVTTHLVSPTLRDAVAAALWAARVTGGILDPTLGHVLVSHGYDRTIREVRQHAVSTPPAPPVDWHDLRLDGQLLTLPPGTLLDLGATAKALAADRAAARAADATRASCLVSIGGDVAVAGPTYPWRVAVAELPAGTAAETLTTYAGGIATSSVLSRRWTVDGGDAHHLIDPRTQAPARSPWRTVTVLAATCLAANVASADAILRGDVALPWLTRQGLPARLVTTDGDVVRTAAWPTPRAAA